MDKICQSSSAPTCTATSSASASASAPASSTTTTTSTTNTGRDQYQLRHLHRISHKISKTSSTITPIQTSSFDPLPPPPPLQPHLHLHPPPPSQPQPQLQPHHHHHHHHHALQLQQQLQNQPPVYNIRKSDFRDVVQKLTGAPPHERISTPPPIHPPKPPSSRLHRIRPPPLSQIANRPSPLLHLPTTHSVNSQHLPLPVIGGGGGSALFPTPLSPLPPLPSCHAAAESPITAYMRFLHGGSTSAVDTAPPPPSAFPPLAPLVSTKFNDPTVLNPHDQFPSQQPPQQQQTQPLIPPPPLLASSPLPFGCFPSPRSPAPLLFSPTGSGQFAFPQLPISPRVSAIPSPK